jgi:long-chain acyl-CoA synthetase
VSSVGELIPASADRSPDKVALIDGDRSITYADLAQDVRRAAAAFAEAGVRKGDRVALLLGNVPGFVIALHGALATGAVVAPLNDMLTPEEIAYILADAGATALVAQRELAPVGLSVRDRVPSLGPVFVTDGGRVPRGTASFDRALAGAGNAPVADISQDDLALLAYTAGTTASPKAAMLTHGNLLANLDQVAQVPLLREVESDVVLLALPLFHIYGLNAALGLTLREGATAVLMDRFDPADSLEAVRRHGVTVLPGAPPMFSAWLRAAGSTDVDLSSVRLAVSGAAALPGDVLEAFRERFGITIWEGYGLTETAPVVTTNAMGERAKPGSIGRPLPGVEVRIVDEEDDEAPEGDPGEIEVRGPNVFRGYWKREEESKQAFRDGWFRTGDVAYRDDDGYLFIVDRSKDLVIVSGFNVYPREVEEAVMSHPKVADCAVVGVPDERTGEAVRALVVPRPGEEVTEEDVLEHCRSRLARFKLPRHIAFVDSLPRHASGKVLRRQLREIDG